jgi:hypothetical protein
VKSFFFKKVDKKFKRESGKSKEILYPELRKSEDEWIPYELGGECFSDALMSKSH